MHCYSIKSENKIQIQTQNSKKHIKPLQKILYFSSENCLFETMLTIIGIKEQKDRFLNSLRVLRLLLQFYKYIFARKQHPNYVVL